MGYFIGWSLITIMMDDNGDDDDDDDGIYFDG